MSNLKVIEHLHSFTNTLEHQLNNTNNDIIILIGRLDNFCKTINDLHDKFNALNSFVYTKLEELNNNQIDSIKLLREQLESKLKDTAGDVIDRVDERLKEVVDTFNEKLENQIDSVEGDQRNLDSRLSDDISDLEDTVNDLDTTLGNKIKNLEMGSVTSDIAEQLAKFPELLKTLEDRIIKAIEENSTIDPLLPQDSEHHPIEF